MQEIDNMQLMIVFLLISIPVLISKRMGVGIEKDMVLSSIRGFLQLLILGLSISYLFSFEKWYVIVAYILFMILIASLNVAKRGANYKKTFIIIFTSFLVSVSFCITLWLLFGIVPFEARYLIPIGGMFTGTAMKAASSVLESTRKLDVDMDAVEKSKAAVKVAVAPVVDMLKTVGLVQIPGTMTGMILAGANPFEAVKYQIFIIFTLVAVESITAIIVAVRVTKKHE